jgi:hypothetical protein
VKKFLLLALIVVGCEKDPVSVAQSNERAGARHTPLRARRLQGVPLR